MNCMMQASAPSLHLLTSHFNEMKGRDSRSAKLIETRHGLESNSVPTSFLILLLLIALLGAKKGYRDQVRL